MKNIHVAKLVADLWQMPSIISVAVLLAKPEQACMVTNIQDAIYKSTARKNVVHMTKENVL